MAFNPFESFRRNSKALLAVLTIFIMFLFVLSTGGGGGDFFDWIARQFGGKDGRGAMMGEIDGREYHEQELNDIRQQRAAANLFMLAAVSQCDAELIAQIEQDVKNGLIRRPDVKQLLDEVRRDYSSVMTNGFAFRFSQDNFERLSAEQLRDQMNILSNSPQLNDRDNAAEIRNLRRAGKVFEHASTMMGFGRSNLFFGEVPNQNSADALYFLMVLKEADRLDIKFTDDDVKKLINDETENILNDEKMSREVDAVVRKQHKLSADKILRAITNEYRMRTALTILRGSRSVPAAQTPYEMFEYYKDRCTPIKFELVDVAVEKYLPLVQGEPSAQELAALYDSYSRTESNPASATPGFKEPRKAKIEFIGVDDTLPVYKQAEPIMRAAMTLTFPLQAITSGNPVSGALFAATPLIVEPIIVRENADRDPIITLFRQGELISRVRHGHPEVPPAPGLSPAADSVILIRLFDFLSNRFLDSYPTPSEQLLYQPLPFASLTAQLATANSPFAATASAVTAMRNTTILLDVRARVAAGMQAAIGPIASNPGFPFTSCAAALANLPTLPESFWIAQHLARQSETKATERRWAMKDFNRLEEKLNEIRKKIAPPEVKKGEEDGPFPKKKDPFKPKKEDVDKANAEARALIDQFIKDRTAKDKPSVVTGRSEKARDQFDMHNDPGLAALTELNRDLKKYTRYQTSFFDAYDPKEDLNAKLYTPVIFPDGRVNETSFKDKTYLAWRIEDEPARQVSYDKISPEMKAEVVRAWKLKKARVLAEEDAKKLSESLKALAQKFLVETDNLPEFRGQMRELVNKNDKWKMLFPDIEIALLTEHVGLQPNTKPTFILPTIRHADIPYPPSTPPDRDDMMSSSRDQWNGRRMALQLLEVRNKPLGETVIVPDTPNMHYYVSVMVQKTPPSIASFYQVFRATQAPSVKSRNPFEQPRDFFYVPFMQKTFIDFRDDFNNRLKADVKYRETEDLKKSLEKRGDSGD
jgi:hypothetical protein